MMVNDNLRILIMFKFCGSFVLYLRCVRVWLVLLDMVVLDVLCFMMMEIGLKLCGFCGW